MNCRALASTCMRGRCDVSADDPDMYGEQSRANRLSTSTGGKPSPTVDSTPQNGPQTTETDADHTPSPTDLARSALAEARQIARAHPNRPVRRGRRETNPSTGQRRSGYSGPAPDDLDPQPIGQVLAGYVEDRGWELPLAEARVFADWTALVGTEIAAHSTPQTLREGELRVAAESTAWATQLRMMASSMLARLVAELGPHVVTKLVITGPAGPSWKHGGYSVRGSRGPRDTYG
jgi:predicted nucleic acid-binding Zn ribbon protein